MTTRRPSAPALEIVAALLVPAAVIGFGRVFVEWSDVAPIVVAALLSSALAALLRRARVPLVIAAVVSLVGLAELIIARYAPGTARYGLLPTWETRDALQLLLDDGADQFRTLRAPVEALPPFVAAAIIGAWLLAFLTDWAALRLRLAFEPVLPAALLFIFASILGSGARQLTSTVIFAAAVALWAVVQRTQTLSEGIWLTVDRQRGPSSIFRAASVVAVIAIAGGVISGPRLPGAGTDELYEWRNRDDPTRQVISPFVSIENRLASQQNIEMFTVVAERPAYWRIAGLDGFENNLWTTRGNFEEHSGELPGSNLAAGTTEPLVQTFTVTGLSAIWLPAAFAPNELLDTGDATITWNSEISTLTVDERPSSDGLTYQLESVLPLYTPEELRAAPAVDDDDLLERYTALPDDLTPALAAEAERLTAGIATDYDKLIALQNEFRTYEYSLELSAPLGDPIEQFLAERIGFCQQFSGTFAAMARSLGLPARVAVGFTWGDPVEGEPNTYRVTGRHAHAWPEVYFEGLGWVAFEPTPGRGAPGADHTGVGAQQDSPVESQPSTTPTTIDPSVIAPPTTFPDDFLADPGFETGAEDIVPAEPGFSVPWRLVGVVVALAAYGAGMPALARLKRARRWAAASSPAEQVEAIWSNLTDDLDRYLGVSRTPSQTRSEWAEHLIRDRRLPDAPLRRLGHVATGARFAPVGALDTTVVDAAELDAAAVTEIIHQRVPAFKRWLKLLDPRWLVGSKTRRAVMVSPS